MTIGTSDPTVKQISITNGTVLPKAARLGAGGVPLPELYKSKGNEVEDRLAFLHMLEQLKIQKRSGWIREGVEQAESIADHMYRMAMLAMIIPTEGTDRPLDIGRCVQMALVHDLAEAHVGDITPVEGVTPEMKHQLEEEAMHSFMHEMLSGEGNREVRERIWSLWEEYEARETPESKLVKDLDRLELVLQAVEYERSQDVRTLAPFYRGSLPHLDHPAVKQWAQMIYDERQALWQSRGLAQQAEEELGHVVIGSAGASSASKQT